VCAFAEAVLKRLQNEVTLNFGYRAADQITDNLFGHHRGMGLKIGLGHAARPWRKDAVDASAIESGKDVADGGKAAATLRLDVRPPALVPL